MGKEVTAKKRGINSTVANEKNLERILTYAHAQNFLPEGQRNYNAAIVRVIEVFVELFLDNGQEQKDFSKRFSELKKATDFSKAEKQLLTMLRNMEQIQNVQSYIQLSTFANLFPDFLEKGGQIGSLSNPNATEKLLVDQFIGAVNYDRDLELKKGPAKKK